ncbi:enoyl-CoA hydratase-related protein [Emticicia sp. W12TSBA100-4]|uniref:enoyl-CoA hydratase/isomerase family protein n=1 Tax=Emticicia sp. W12TSBA100-4 TaxID=3160965 RepID=UPI00330652C1
MFFKLSDIQKFHSVEFQLIKAQQNDNLFTITLNRAEKRNAFTPTMLQELAFALEFAHQANDIWCVLIQAEGPAFCAGMDLTIFQNPALDIQNESLPKPMKEITIGDAFKNLEKPCIAKVEGSVFAGGFLIIGGCSFVVSVNDALFGLPEVKRGIFPMQVMATLLKIMPQRKVMEMAILGKNYSAKEAFELGIVTHISLKENIEQETKSLINSILENSPFAIKKGFEAINNFSNLPENQQHHYLLGILQEIRESEDAKEGILAFKEKRKPVWRNR